MRDTYACGIGDCKQELWIPKWIALGNSYLDYTDNVRNITKLKVTFTLTIKALGVTNIAIQE